MKDPATGEDIQGPYTTAEAKAWCEREADGIRRGFDECEEMPSWIRKAGPTGRFYECWKAGCWLNEMLRKHGATPDEVFQIGFCHGQRSAFGDAWVWARFYANEYACNHAISDKPGIELADQINYEVLGLCKPTDSKSTSATDQSSS